MDIIQRNFMRLLRQGAFGKTYNKNDAIEPMSAWKWNKLYEISQIHGVTPWIRDGIKRNEDDFFLQISSELRSQFETDRTNTNEELPTQELTNPILNKRLQQIIATTDAQSPTLELLLRLIQIARNILTQGISLRQLIMLGTQLRIHEDTLDNELLKGWINQLNMETMVKLEGSLLIELFMFRPEEYHFVNITVNKSVKRAVRDIFLLTEKKAADWYFTQGKSIFVRTSDSDAMMWHVKQSTKYMHYYPAEAFTNFVRNFTHSLSHIEE